MDFNQLDIRRFLINSLPGRFNQLSPSEFESFIKYLFQVDGYEVEEISKKSDLTAHLLAKKEDTSLVIRVMRNLSDQMAGVLEVQQAMAARDFYETEQSWIITTSGFTEEAKTLAEGAGIELWDWDALNLALSELFFEGKNYLDFAEPVAPKIDTAYEPEMKLKVKWAAQEGVGDKWYNLSLTITNSGDQNVYLYLDPPVLIDHQKNQSSAEKWADDEFVSGMIYAGASVRTNALFKTSRLGDRPPGGKIVVTCHERDPQRTYHLMARLKGEACYFVTYCYSRQSPEYMIMTKFRDEVLINTWYGRLGIDVYYFISPYLIGCAPTFKFLDNLIRKVTLSATRSVIKFYKQKQKHAQR